MAKINTTIKLERRHREIIKNSLESRGFSKWIRQQIEKELSANPPNETIAGRQANAL